MKICVAQTKPIRGEVQKNIENHKRLIDLAIKKEAEVIVFPELSLTGYEPTLAKKLASTKDDKRFDVFQNLSDKNQITICVGMPTKNDLGTCISLVIFQSNQVRQIYSKKYLHSDEEAFFVSGENSIGLLQNKITFAICYEISIPEHSENAFRNGAKIYIASVAKTKNGVEQATKTLSEIAKKYSMTALMSNSVGDSEDGVCTGKSAIWNKEGLLVEQLNEAEEGVLVFDCRVN
ncbi:MAG: carbon-nitrogen hydrolase family protein [Calditrichaeota bacterium]|nr:MAG: carbon-nitrogen hydrolase family protein [Calditrichota bacterium]